MIKNKTDCKDYKNSAFPPLTEHLKATSEEGGYKQNLKGWIRFSLGKLHMGEEWGGMRKGTGVGNLGQYLEWQ